jgi:hypothetical protein
MKGGRAVGWTTLVLTLIFESGCAGVSQGASSEDLADRGGDASPTDDFAATAFDFATTSDLAGSDLAGATSCNPANLSLGAGGGPDACAYGQRCDGASSTCQPVSNGSCNMVMGAPVWDAAGKAAPVIANVSATLLSATNSTTECANGDPAALVTVDYYAPMTLTTATQQTTFLSQVKFKKSVVSSDPFYDGTFMRAMPMPNQKTGTFKVGINCGGAAGSVKTAGFYIVDGGGRTSNLVCVSW